MDKLIILAIVILSFYYVWKLFSKGSKNGSCCGCSNNECSKCNKEDNIINKIEKKG